jgi:alpha-mannosidase
MTVGYELEIPDSLAVDRKSRQNPRPYGITLRVTLYSGLKRIDLDAEVENSAHHDHRLRVALRTPVHTSEAVSDTSFGVLKRPLTPTEPRGTEAIYPTVPHRSVTAIESDSLSVALMSRGIYEIEARPDDRGTTLLLTLLRCVGWLSRSDLAMRDGGAGPEFETPGAQEPGPHTFHFAITTYLGSYLEADLMHRAATYTSPPRIFIAREPSEVASMQLFSCDNPRVMFSTVTPGKRANTYVARAFSVSPEPEKARFSFGTEDRRARIVDLADRPMKRAMRRRQGSLELNLRPFEIVSFRVSEKIFRS